MGRTMFRTMMQNSKALKLFCKESLNCTKLKPFCDCKQWYGWYGCYYVEIWLSVCGFLNLNLNQGVITAKSFQNTIYNWSGIVILHVPKKCFWTKISMSEYFHPFDFSPLDFLDVTQENKNAVC